MYIEVQLRPRKLTRQRLIRQYVRESSDITEEFIDMLIEAADGKLGVMQRLFNRWEKGIENAQLRGMPFNVVDFLKVRCAALASSYNTSYPSKQPSPLQPAGGLCYLS